MLRAPRRLRLITLALVGSCVIAVSLAAKPATPTSQQLYTQGIQDFRAGRYSAGLANFTRVIQSFPDDARYPAAAYMAAFCYYRLGRTREGLEVLDAARRRDLAPDIWDDITALHAELSAAQGDNFGAARDYLAVLTRGLDPRLAAIAQQRGTALVNDVLTLDELSQLHRLYNGQPIDALILLALGRAFLAAGKYREATGCFETVTLRYANTEYAAQATKPLEISRLGGPTGRVGLLVPLTGSFAYFGQEVKAGVEYALRGAEKITLEVLDTGSDPARAAAGVATLVKERKVDAIIGPVSSREALAAAPVATELGVVLVVPTATEPAIADASRFVFELNAYAYHEARRVARYALERLGYRRFAILYPDDARGQGLAGAFADAVSAGGGSVVQRTGFNPLETTLRRELGTLAGADALFLPASSDQIVLIAPQLTLFRVRARLLGTDDFRAEKVVREGGRDVEGAIFVASAHADASDPRTLATFYEGFASATGRQPSDLAALGYDAARLLRVALVPPYTRSSLADRLRGEADFSGVIGRLSFQESDAHRVFRVYTIVNGQIKELEA